MGPLLINAKSQPKLFKPGLCLYVPIMNANNSSEPRQGIYDTFHSTFPRIKLLPIKILSIFKQLFKHLQ